MSSIEITRRIAEAEKRIDAMVVLCSVLLGQAKGERRQLEQLQAAITSPPAEETGHARSADIEADMLQG